MRKFHENFISIRAPVWGAIKKLDAEWERINISIRAPVWGAITFVKYSITQRTYFNPRTRVGCDRIRIIQLVYLMHFNPRTRVGCDFQNALDSSLPNQISIRAPVWGAIGNCNAYSPSATISIRAPVWGAMYNTRRVRNQAGYFNPRTRVGCDFLLPPAVFCYFISIRAPVWGAIQSLIYLL